MKMHALSGGQLRPKKSLCLPDADRAEAIDVGATVLCGHGAQQGATLKKLGNTYE